MLYGYFSCILIYIDYITRYLGAMQLEPHYRKKAAEAIEAEFNNISKIHILLRAVWPAFSRCVILDLRGIGRFQTARTALAIERYRQATGNLPDTLSELIPGYLDAIPQDPFDGEPLRYKKLDVGFVVYSIGEDGLDDGAKERPSAKMGRNISNDYDITFKIER